MAIGDPTGGDEVTFGLRKKMPSSVSDGELVETLSQCGFQEKFCLSALDSSGHHGVQEDVGAGFRLARRYRLFFVVT